MSITLELTDDQALQIVAQLGTMLSRKTATQTTTRQRAKRDPYSIERVVTYITSLPKGTQFKISKVAYDLGINNQKVSSAVKGRARADNLCKMIKKGTWERI